MKPLLRITVALALITSTVFAQGERKLQIRTLCLEQVKGLEKVRLFAGDESKEDPEVALYGEVSPVIESTFKTNEAIFCTEKTGADGKIVRTPVGKVTLGKSSQQLFVFIPSGGGEGKLPYQIQAYDDDLKTFALGSVRAINLAPVPVRFILSGAVTPQIPPGKYAQFPHSTKVDEYNMYSVVTEFLSANGEWVKGQSTSWKATDRRREIVITLVDMKYKQPGVQMFSDFPPWATPGQ